MIGEFKAMVKQSDYAVAFTGAGISTESGLSDYRSQMGMWKQFNPFRVATGSALRSDPEGFFKFYRSRLAGMADVEPNDGHAALARLERMGKLKTVITQNVDNLHQKAGSTNVIELHGSLARARCMVCDQVSGGELLTEKLSQPDTVIPRCECGGIIRPDVVLFEEPLPEREIQSAFAEAFSCDLMIVIGSSLTVWPAAGIPSRAVRHGAKLVIINAEPTPLDDEADLVFHQQAGDLLSQLIDGM